MKTLRTAAIVTATATAALTSVMVGTGAAHANGSAPHAATARAAVHLPATKVTTANLPTTAEIKVPNARATVFSTVRGDGQEAMTTCQTHAWGDYKPNAVFTRVYATRVTGSPRPTYSGATIASFATHAAAVKAASQMASSFACTAQAKLTDGYLSDSARTTTRTVTLASGQVVHLSLLTFDSSHEPQVDTVESNAVVATGTHVELVSLHYFASTGTATTSAALATVQAALPTLAK